MFLSETGVMCGQTATTITTELARYFAHSFVTMFCFYGDRKLNFAVNPPGAQQNYRANLHICVARNDYK
jgi:hypothetical protein